MFNANLRAEVARFSFRVDRITVRHFEAATRADAASSFGLRRMGLTASHQCAGFGASVLVGLGYSCRDSSAMGFTCFQEPLDLVDQLHDHRVVDDRLVDDGLDHAEYRSAKRTRHHRDGRFSADRIHGTSVDSIDGRMCRRVVPQPRSPRDLETRARLWSYCQSASD